MVSQARSDWSSERRVPATLPADLAAVVTARADAAMNRVALDALYAPDAWFLESFSPGFVHPREAIVNFWIGNTNAGYGLEPVGYTLDGTSASVTSYMLNGETGDIDAHMLHSLARQPDGRWLITSEVLTMGAPYVARPIDARELVEHLDSAGIRRGVVFSVAYLFAGRRQSDGELDRLRAENDWTAAQVALYPDRLIAFCAVNPLRSWAEAEVRRCGATGAFRGLKLHVGNSGVNFDDGAHVAALRRVFEVANEERLAIVIHLMPWGSPYGAAQARRFLEEVLPGASDVDVQIAHMGSHGRLDRAADEAVGVLAEAVAANDPRTRRLWFDVTTTFTPEATPEEIERGARRVRQIGVDRILYGSDTPDDAHLAPREGWAAFRTLAPLTDAEFRTIAGNLPQYAR